MTNIRRYFKPGSVYFLTHVTQNRKPILVDNFDLLKESVKSVRQEYPFDLIAWVVLPDHCHLLINPLDYQLSSLMRKIKLQFSSKYRSRVGLIKGQVWQNRFWDHVIRDEIDMTTHFDYIHINPAKHGLVENPFGWPYSSAVKYVEQGFYSDDWSGTDSFDGEFGE